MEHGKIVLPKLNMDDKSSLTIDVKKNRVNLFNSFLKFLYLLLIAAYGYFLIDGLGYYQLPREQRLNHPKHRELRSAGSRGLAFGIVGFSMLFAVLIYSIRKRTRLFGTRHSTKHWLHLHIFLGIAGPMFVLLHASFRASDLVAIGFWSMIVVVITGLFGRYFYLLIPRDTEGEELSLHEIAQADHRYNRELLETLQLDEWHLGQLEAFVSDNVDRNRGAIRTLITVISNDLFHPYRIHRLKKRCARELRLEEPYLRRVVHLLWRKITLQNRVLLLNRTRQFLNYWLVLHKSFAVILYIIMLIHVGIAIWLGYF